MATNYTSQFTGMQIDAVISKLNEKPLSVKDGGIGLTEIEIDQFLVGNGIAVKLLTPVEVLEKIGASPAGYGLGRIDGDADYTQVVKDLNTIIPNGWFYWSSGTSNSPENLGRGLSINRTANESSQICITELGYILHRFTEDGGNTWQQDWFNPPMVAGKEYRTIERWNGKPVYTKLIKFGSLPANSSKTMAIGVVGLNVISIVGSAYNESIGEYTSFPIGSNGSFGAYFWVSNNGNIGVRTMADLSSYSAQFVIKYIKE